MTRFPYSNRERPDPWLADDSPETEDARLTHEYAYREMATFIELRLAGVDVTYKRAWPASVITGTSIVEDCTHVFLVGEKAPCGHQIAAVGVRTEHDDGSVSHETACDGEHVVMAGPRT